MRNRLLHRVPTRAFALSLVAAAAVLLMPQLAAPAHAAQAVTSFEEGDIVKLKTTWQGGFVLNTGGTAGTNVEGAQAKIHWNFDWDRPNRFRVTPPVREEGGMRWFQLKSTFGTNKCLSAPTHNFAYVTQQDCNFLDPAQYWAGQWGWGVAAWIRNLGHHRAGLNTVLSQVHHEFVGTQVRMETLIPNPTRQDWILYTCLVGGVEQKVC